MVALTERILAGLGAGAPLEICDVGANPIGGAAPYQPLLDRGIARVTGFEPQPEALEKLRGLASDRETYLPHAVGDGRPAVLRLYSGSGFASCFPVDARTVRTLDKLRPYTRLREEIPLRTVRLDDIASLAPIDFLKIDVQGSELAVIRNGRDKLAQAVAVQTEVRFFPLYEGEPSFGELDSELRRQGFQLHDFVGIKRFRFAGPHAGLVRRRHKRQLLDADAIYVADPRTLDARPDEAVRKLAILSLLVFDSRDLTVFCLTELSRRGLFDDALTAAFAGEADTSA